jgi:hypothetical protein
VDETAWCACTDPETMLRYVRRKASRRKLRLFAVACCRRICTWPLLTDERSRQAVEVAERFADGRARRRELRFACSCAADAYAFAHSSGTADTRAAAGAANAADADAHYYAAHVTPRQEHLGLLRDLLGPLLFRPVVVASSCRTPAVLAVAKSIYEQRRFEDMPILADALEESGCCNDEILSHCREQAWGHARGCWIIDLLLHKE